MTKTKTDEYLRWGGIAFLVYLFATNAFNAAYNNILFGIPRISLGSVSLTGVDASISIPITNNTPIAITLDSVMANIVYGQYILAQVNMFESRSIPANGTINMDFSTRLNFAQLSSNIAALISSGQLFQQLKIVGTLRSAGINFPFSNTISVG